MKKIPGTAEDDLPYSRLEEGPVPFAADPANEAAINRILSIEGAIDPDTCRQLREYAATKERQPIGTQYRETFMINHNDIKDMLGEMLHRIFAVHIEPHYGLAIEWWEIPQFLVYTKGCKYPLHADGGGTLDPAKMGEGRAYNRDISVILYLNDNFTGGQLSFPDYQYKITPKPGLLVAFPSTVEYRHEAEVTESGERLVIVTWAAAVGTLRLQERKQTGKIFMKNFTS